MGHNDGPANLALVGNADGLQGFDFSPDYKSLAVAGEDERIRIIDAETGAHLQDLSLFGGPVRDVAFSPDGRDWQPAIGDAP